MRRTVAVPFPHTRECRRGNATLSCAFIDAPGAPSDRHAEKRPLSQAPIRSAVALAFLLTVGCDARAASTDVDVHYSGVAYAIDGTQVRYREEHWTYLDGTTPARLVLYRCPGGQPFARKWLRYVAAPWTPEFDFEDARDGYEEGVRLEEGQWRVHVRANATAMIRTATIESRSNLVIDAGFDAFVRAHWAALTQAEGLPAIFVVPGRLDTLTLRLKPMDGSPIGTRRFRLRLDGWLAAWAPSVELTYSESDHRLEQFTGVSNIRDEHGRPQRVRIAFPASDRESPGRREDLELAAKLPLVSRCPP